MSSVPTKTTGFTAEEEARIQAGVDEYKQKEREIMIESEIRNRILDEQKKKPGHRYC